MVIMPFHVLCQITSLLDEGSADSKFIEHTFSEVGNVVFVHILEQGNTTKGIVEFESKHSVADAMRLFHEKSFVWGQIQVFRLGDSDAALLLNIAQNKKRHFTQSKLVVYKDSQTMASDSRSGSWHKGEFDKVNNSDHPQIDRTPPQKMNISAKIKLSTHLPNPISRNTYSSQKEETLSTNSPLFEANQNLRNSQSNIISISPFKTSIIKGYILSNFLGCFGNVVRVIINAKRHMAYVEFDLALAAIRSLKFLKDFVLFNLKFKAKLTEADFSLDRYISDNRNDLEITFPLVKFYRFKQGLNIKVNCPSKLLHITSVDDDIDTEFLYILLTKIKEPKTIYLLRKRSKGSRMFIIEFEAVSDAAEVLSVLHNKQVGSRLMKISFSHARIAGHF
jgi:hypothetical protein